MNYEINSTQSLFLTYLIIVNLLSFSLFGIDKRRSKKKLWRIPESTLLGISLLGGSLGSIFGMSFFRHKTKKKKFTILVPIFLLINIYLLFYLHPLIK